MKKLIGVYLLWTLGLVASFFLALLIYVRTPAIQGQIPSIRNTTGGYGHSLLRYDELDELESTDVLFLGSSQTYRGYDPRIFNEAGINSFNAGSSAQTPLNTYYLLERYIDDIDVDLLVFETYWAIAANPDGKESAIDLSSNMEVDKSNIIMALQSKNFEAINSVFANLVNQWVYDDALDLNLQTDVRKNEYVSGGFVESTREINLERLEEETKDKRDVEFEDMQISFVRRIVELARDRDIEIMFVRTPVTQELLDSVENYEDTLVPYQMIADEFGLTYIDFNDEKHRQKMGLITEEDFYDKNHLNQNGVDKYNNYLVPFVQAELDDIDV